MSESVEKIGKYAILAELGRGAMGVVYKGLDPDINRHVAIKTMLLFSDDDQASEVAKRFKQEARAAGRLNHRNIISVYDFGETESVEFIVMEFIEGETLEDRVARLEIPDLASTCRTMVTILRALDYAHKSGVVHRDIKPANIMLTPDGEIKIADFGIARIESSELTRVGTIMGTPAYMSPEQLLGQPIDLRSDIFAAGVLFYELLTGERAFQGTNINTTSYKVIHTELPPVSKICPSLPAGLDTILERALRKSPQERYTSAEEFAVAIEALMGNSSQLTSGATLVGANDQTRVAGAAPAGGLEPTVHVESQVKTGGKRFGWLAAAFVLLVAVGIAAVQFGWLLQPKSAAVPAEILQDCDVCPEMVVLPVGSFEQGSPVSEAGRQPSESPRHTVMISQPIAVGKYEVTRGEFAAFASATGHISDSCSVYDGDWKALENRNWQAPGFAQDDRHPVTCVSWSDAIAYTEWLAALSGKPFRLMSSAEWEYAARAGSTAANDWLDDDGKACGFANVADKSAGRHYKGWQTHGCADGAVHTLSVSQRPANAFGLHNMLGNVFEWVQDCWNDSYSGAPEGGTPWLQGDCSQRVLRGGSWFSQPQFVRFAYRNHFAKDFRASTFGFRVALSLDPASQQVGVTD